MKSLLTAFSLLITLQLAAHLNTTADSLRGSLRPERTCYDVSYYDLTVDFNPDSQSISGTNQIHFVAVEAYNKIQIDLFSKFSIDEVTMFTQIDSFGMMEITSPSYTMDSNAFFVDLQDDLQVGRKYQLKVKYHGKPNIAKKAPWDGGFVWSKDSLQRHFAGVACEGWGASSWWPCKDHLSDEPDSMKLTYIVPKGYDCIGNGVLQKHSVVEVKGVQKEQFIWRVSYPINNYNVTFYLGSFKPVEGIYTSGNDTLKTFFYALDYNYEKAKLHFKQVNPMLAVYEELFGRFPFWNDDYKLVEAPYLGMEHQTAIAYGNKYKKGYLGHHVPGVEFDYIIIHETGHEYWGNSISMSDLADMWIHEGFCTYTEVLYVEKMYGKEKVNEYLLRQRFSLKNDETIVGEYGLNKEGGGDMYNKGSLMLHTMRNQLQNDSLWFATVKGFYQEHAFKITNTQEVLTWFETSLGKNYKSIMELYLFNADLPVLEVKEKKSFWRGKSFEYRWAEGTQLNNMKLKFVGGKQDVFLVPDSDWQTVKTKSFKNPKLLFDWSFALFELKSIKN